MDPRRQEHWLSLLEYNVGTPIYRRYAPSPWQTTVRSDQIFGAAASTSGEHCDENSSKFLRKRPAKLTAVFWNSSSLLPDDFHANWGFRMFVGTPLTSLLGSFRPKTGISSHSDSGKLARVPSWMASMSALVYLRLQRSPTP